MVGFLASEICDGAKTKNPNTKHDAAAAAKDGASDDKPLVVAETVNIGDTCEPSRRSSRRPLEAPSDGSGFVKKDSTFPSSEFTSVLRSQQVPQDFPSLVIQASSQPCGASALKARQKSK